MKEKVFYKWFLGVVLNAAATFYLAFVYQFPLWIVLLALVLLDGVPLLWKVKIIPHTRNVDENFILGFWIFVLCIFFVFCIPPANRLILNFLLPNPFIVIVGIVLYIVIFAWFAGFRTQSIRNFLDEGSK